MKKRIHVYYSGRVQGVGFRFITEDLAGNFGVTGWVKNLADSRVELVAEAEESVLKDFLSGIRKYFREFIQDEDIENIAKTSAIGAAKKCNLPILVEDAGLFIEMLNGFPGPYSSYIYRTLGTSGVLKLMKNLKKREDSKKARTGLNTTSPTFCSSQKTSQKPSCTICFGGPTKSCTRGIEASPQYGTAPGWRSDRGSSFSRTFSSSSAFERRLWPGKLRTRAASSA